jgi:hypothetical protein
MSWLGMHSIAACCLSIPERKSTFDLARLSFPPTRTFSFFHFTFISSPSWHRYYLCGIHVGVASGLPSWRTGPESQFSHSVPVRVPYSVLFSVVRFFSSQPFAFSFQPPSNDATMDPKADQKHSWAHLCYVGTYLPGYATLSCH